LNLGFVCLICYFVFDGKFKRDKKRIGFPPEFILVKTGEEMI